MPIIFPLRSGKSQSTDFDAPVVCGIMLLNMDRLVRFLSCASSTIDCEAVAACTVMKDPSLTPPAIWLAAAKKGAMQLVVHDAAEIMRSPL